jgi:release factor glutamine methyltransferase
MKAIKQIIDNAKINKRDAKYVLMHLLKLDSTAVVIQNNNIVDETNIQKFEQISAQISQGIPLAYAINNASFMGLDFYVDQNVLIPRPETEQLVEVIINYTNQIKAQTVLDMCTGSGCILVSLLHFTNLTGIGADISKKALSIAKQNAIANNVESKATFIQTDMFANINNTVDIIVSNPPYIPTHEMLTLESNVLDHEPHLALHGGQTGLDFYEIIAKQAKQYLTKNGAIFLEIGYNQGDDIIKLFKSVGYANVEIAKDYAKHDRIAKIYL